MVTYRMSLITNSATILQLSLSLSMLFNQPQSPVWQMPYGVLKLQTFLVHLQQCSMSWMVEHVCNISPGPEEPHTTRYLSNTLWMSSGSIYGSATIVFDGYSETPSTNDGAHWGDQTGINGVTVHFSSSMALQRKRKKSCQTGRINKASLPYEKMSHTMSEVSPRTLSFPWRWQRDSRRKFGNNLCFLFKTQWVERQFFHSLACCLLDWNKQGVRPTRQEEMQMSSLYRLLWHQWLSKKLYWYTKWRQMRLTSTKSLLPHICSASTRVPNFNLFRTAISRRTVFALQAILKHCTEWPQMTLNTTRLKVPLICDTSCKDS